MNLMSFKQQAAVTTSAAPQSTAVPSTSPESANAKLAMPSTAIDPVASLLEASPVEASPVEAPAVPQVSVKEGDRVTDGKRHGTYIGIDWVKWDGNTKRSKVEDWSKIDHSQVNVTVTGRLPDSEASETLHKGDFVSVSASASTAAPSAGIMLPRDFARMIAAPAEAPEKEVQAGFFKAPTVTLYIGCVPNFAYMTTNQLLNDKGLVGDGYWAKNAFSRRDELLFGEDRSVRAFLESEGFDHIIHLDDSPDSKTMAALIERVADRVIRAVK